MKLHLLFICLAAGFWSCEYQLDSENFLEIAPPDTTKMIQVNLSPFETQYVFTVPTWVSYDLNTFGLKVYNVEFFVGDQLIHSGNEAVGGFVFDPSPWGIGTQNMLMVVTTGTNSGSLADLLEAEGFLFQQKWEVLLDGGNPAPVEITDIYNNDGILKIEWEEYERFNFQKYILYKNFGEAEGETFAHPIAEITDPTQHSWQDSSFIGGTGIYWVEVHASNQKATSKRKQFDFPKLTLETLWVAGDSASFQWTKNAFYRTVDQVTITVPDFFPKPAITLFSSGNPSDTTCVVKDLRFGNSSTYTLSVYPKTNIRIYEDNQVTRSSVSFGIGNRLSPFGKFTGDPVNGFFYVYDNGKIIQYTYPEIVKQDSCESSSFARWFVSFYDQKLVTQIYSDINMYPPDRLDQPTTYNSWDLGLYEFWSDFSISYNNRMVFPAGSGTGLYDWSTRKIVFKTAPNEPDRCSLSPDGKYVFSKNYLGYSDQSVIKIWQVAETGLVAVGQLSVANYSRESWLPGNGHQLAVLKGSEYNIPGVTENKFGIYDAETSQAITEFPVKAGYFSGIDPTGKLVAFTTTIPEYYYNQYVYLYNYETGKEDRRVSLSQETSLPYLYRSHLFSSKGFCIDISVF